MLKSHKIQSVLDQDDNYDSFYNKPVEEKKDEPLPRGYDDDADVAFYGTDDLDFMRFHKRTKSNMQDCLQQVVLSSKQTMAKGVRMMNEVSINYVDLNKPCSLLVAYWTINTMPLSIIP